MMMRKVLPALACVALLCATAQAGVLFDTINGGLSPITPTYVYNMGAEVGPAGSQLNSVGWLHNAPAGTPTGNGLITGAASEGSEVKSYNSAGDSWEVHHPNDANWDFSLPAETKIVEIDFLGDFTEVHWLSVGIGSTLNGAGEVWDIEFGIDDAGWVQTRVRGVNWFDLYSSGLVHGWSGGLIEFQLLWDMENHQYMVDGYGKSGIPRSSGWQSIPSSAWGSTPSAYSRTPDELDLISMLNSVNNGVIEIQITGLGDPIPEPGTLMLLGLGLSGLVFYGWRRRK